MVFLFFLFSGFIQKVYISYGTAYGYGRVQVRDFDRDGYVDLIFTWYDWNTYRQYICYIEVLLDSYDLVDTLYLGGMI